MKTTKKLLLVGTMAVFCYSIGSAQIIYSNAFNSGTGNIQGTSPNTANDYAGGYSSATWNDALGANDTGMMTAGGVDSSTLGDSWTLPFTPQAGYVYHLTATLTFTGDPGNWVGIGFSQNNSYGVPVGYGRFSDSGNGGPNGYDWMILTEGNGNVQQFTGPHGTGQIWNQTPTFTAGTGTHTVDIVLDTSRVQWSIAASVDGTQLATSSSANLIIGAVGITQNAVSTPSAYQWSNLMLTATPVPITNNTYWVAPTAVGTGDGSSSANAASYLDGGFWSGVQSLLQATNVTVNFVDGTYNAGTLNLNDMGNAVHQLTLQAVNLNGPVFNTANNLVGVTGSQNIKFDGIIFTGSSPYWGVICQPDGLKPCRNLEFSHCQFINLTNVLYGAIGLVNGVRDVLVDNCTFTNLTANNGNHQHMIYASHDIVDVVVTNCFFQDCLADYVRFRDNCEYCTVENCAFVSTMSASAWPFISSELYNDTNSDAAGDEFFGNYFQISGNSFTYEVSGGPGPYSAFHFSDTGYSPYSYHCDLTSSQARQLSHGSVSSQQSFLQANMGIIASGIKMFGNTYSGVGYAVDYTYNAGNEPGATSQGPIDISGVPDSSGATLASIPVLRNGDFDRQGLQLTPQTSSTPNECLFQTWFCNPEYADILSHPGFDGTTNAMRFDGTQNQYIYQWISNPTPTWTMDCLFAIGSGFNGSGTKFKVDIFHNDLTGGKVSVGVDNLGRFGIYNGGTFTVLSGLGTVAFSVDNDSNGNYTDPGDTLNVYHLRIVGHYEAATPYVDIYTSDANTLTLTNQALGLTNWVNGAPVSGQSAPGTIAFYNYTAPVMLDQITFATGNSNNAPPPNAPTALSAAGGNLVANLNWTQSTSPGITGNNVYRSTNGSGGPYNLLASLAATTSYSDTAVAAGNTYFYSVTAVNTNGESALSAYAGATTIPAAPTGLSAAAGNAQVTLSWTASTGASSYNVKRATVSGGPYMTVASGVATSSYTDATVTNGTTYYYVVSAVNSSGESGNSAEVSAMPNASTAPAAPTNLTASAGRKKVSLTWTQSTSPNITTNNIYQATVSGGPYSLIGSVAATTSYNITRLQSGTTYYYVVTAVNGSGLESPYSNAANATAK